MATAGPSKYLEVSRRIEAEIAGGRWRGRRMPGVRAIAALYGVSAVTAARSVQVLRERGLIRSVPRSGSFAVDVDAGPAAGAAGPGGAGPGGRWALCFRTTPGPWQRAAWSVTMGGFEALAASAGLEFAADAFAIGEGTAPDAIDAQARRAAEAGVSGLFFLPSRTGEAATRQDERLLEACRAAGLPAVLVERNLRGEARPLDHDLVAADDREGAARCVDHLLAAGRRRVAFVRGAPTSSHEDRLAGYLLAVHRAAGRGTPGGPGPIVIEHRADLPTREGHRRLAEALIESEADGVVCYQDTAAIGLTVELLARRVQIPEELAIVGFEDLPIGSSFSLGLTTYALDSVGIAAEALRLIRRRIDEPDARPVKVTVPGRLIVRESGPQGPAAAAPATPSPATRPRGRGRTAR